VLSLTLVRLIALFIALGTVGCVHAPRSKTAGYVGSAGLIGMGSLMVWNAKVTSCSDGSLGDNIGCDIGNGFGEVLGITSIALGVVGLGITAAVTPAATH
jgi:hypothetical protein